MSQIASVCGFTPPAALAAPLSYYNSGFAPAEPRLVAFNTEQFMDIMETIREQIEGNRIIPT